MRIVGFLAAVLVSIAIGAAVVVWGQLATREPKQGWVVAVGGDSFVVLDKAGAPAEVSTVDVGETYCYNVHHGADLQREPVQRWRVAPDDPPGLAPVPSAV